MPFSVEPAVVPHYICFNSIFRVVLSFFNTFSIIKSERQEIQVVRRMMIGSDEHWG